jgi:hypothetical protein
MQANGLQRPHALSWDVHYALDPAQVCAENLLDPGSHRCSGLAGTNNKDSPRPGQSFPDREVRIGICGLEQIFGADRIDCGLPNRTRLLA